MTDKEWNQLIEDLSLWITGWDMDDDEAEDRAFDAASDLADLEVADLDRPNRMADLKRLLQCDCNYVRECVGNAISQVEGLAALSILLDALERNSAEGCDNDGFIGAVADPVEQDPLAAEPILLERLQSDNEKTRARAAWLYGFGHKGLPPEPLIQALNDPSPEVRSSAAGSLGSYKDSATVVAALQRLLNDPVTSCRAAAAEALGWIGNPQTVETLIAVLEDSDSVVRRSACYALGSFNNHSEAVAALQEMLQDDDEYVCSAASESLEKD